MLNVKNNITRLLDSKNISYTIRRLPKDIRSAAATAEFLKAPLSHVVKSIVLERVTTGKPIVAMIPATAEADPKKIAKLINEKKVAVTTLQRAETLTHLKAGGISPLLLLNRGFQFMLDQTVAQEEEIYISGGQVGLNIQMPVAELVAIVRPVVGDISKFKD